MIPSQQQFTITLVIGLIGLFGLLALGGAVYLLADGKPAGELGNLASAALGSLATMLATTRTTEKSAGQGSGDNVTTTSEVTND